MSLLITCPERAICHVIVALGLSSTLQFRIAERVCAKSVSAGSSEKRKAQGISAASGKESNYVNKESRTNYGQNCLSDHTPLSTA